MANLEDIPTGDQHRTDNAPEEPEFPFSEALTGMAGDTSEHPQEIPDDNVQNIGGITVRGIVRKDEGAYRPVEGPQLIDSTDEFVDGVPTEEKEEEIRAGENVDEPKEVADLEPEADSPINYLRELGLEEGKLQETIEILETDDKTLVKKYLEKLGVDETKIDETTDWVGASPIRLMLTRLKELGLPEDKADEAHRILVTEKGQLKVKHIIDLGFGPEEASEVQELFKSSPANLLRERLESLGYSEDEITDILVTSEDNYRLLKENLKNLDIEEDVIEQLVEYKKGVEIHKQLAKELGYEDAEKIKKAHHARIPHKAIEKGLKLGYPIDLLIAAAEGTDKGLHSWLLERGIPLPGKTLHEIEEGEEPIESKKKMRKANREAANVRSLYPSGDPHQITRSEIDYYRERIIEKPGWLRQSLIPPAGLPVPRALYYNGLTRPMLDVVNRVFYLPISQRLLARRLFNNERERNPDEDYGMLGYGREKRRQIMDHIRKVDKTINRTRRLLSWSGGHALRGDIRDVARLDVAQDIAEVKRDILAFSMGRANLPSEQEQFEMLLNKESRTKEEEERIELLKRLHREW